MEQAMKTVKITFIVLWSVVSLCAMTVISQEQSENKEITEIMQEVMAQMMELAQPGPEHQLLEKMAGEWKQEYKMWMVPGGEAIVSEGHSVNKMILGGRFLMLSAESEAMGMKSEALTIMGYDRRNEVYTTIGFDSWGTYYVTASGKYDSTINEIRMYGEDVDAKINMVQKYDMVVREISEDKYISEIIFYDSTHTLGAESFKMMEVTSTRVNE